MVVVCDITDDLRDEKAAYNPRNMTMLAMVDIRATHMMPSALTSVTSCWLGMKHHVLWLGPIRIVYKENGAPVQIPKKPAQP